MPAIDPAKDRVTGLLISRDPLIVWGWSNPPDLAGPGTSLAPHVGNRRAYFLFSPAWTRERPDLVAMDLAHIAALRQRWPEHRHIVLCNTRAELQRYRMADLPGIVCTASVFVDDDVFDVAADRQPTFDAIYNAQLVPYKRHELCTAIDSLLLVYHRFSDPATPADYPDRIRAMLPSAIFVNDLGGTFRLLNGTEIAGWNSRAHVGLALSAEEGQSRATAEYLLCGLPVVTTPNIGGRNRLLDPSCAIEVPPDPAAVAGAVRELVRRRPDPHAIRAAALQKIEADRGRLLQLIAAIFRGEGRAFPEHADWRQLFRRGSWPVGTVERLFASTAIAETVA